MAVSFTPNIGLAKPDKTELGLEWARNTKLAEDNNLIIVDKMDVNFLSYTPTFVGPTTNPNVGAGSISGEYFEIAGYIFGSFVVRILTPGFADGTGVGSYGIKLPTLVDTAFHTVGTNLDDTVGALSCIGEGYLRDSSANNTTGTLALDVVQFGGNAYARMITDAIVGKTSRTFSPGSPFSLADSDRFSGSFFYKKA